MDHDDERDFEEERYNEALLHEVGPEEPEESDVTTHDHQRFYQYGKLWLEVPASASKAAMWKRIDAKMKHESFFPAVFFISDHGNAHLMERPKKKSGSAHRKERQQRARHAEADRLIARAEKKYGGFGHGSLISGGFYSHWPEAVKNKIRKLRHGK